MSGLQLQVNTCFAVKNWPLAADWLPCVRSWGIDAVQFSLDLLDPQLPGAVEMAREIRDQAGAAGVRIGSTFTGTIAYVQNMLLHPDGRYREAAFRWYERAVEITAAMGAAATGGHLGALSAGEERQPSRRAERLAEQGRLLVELSRLARRKGLEYLVWEMMPSSREVPHFPEEALELLSNLNRQADVPIYLCFDLGHACGEDVNPDGETAYRWLEQLLPVTRMIHLQQTDGLGDHHWPFTGEFNARGIIDPGRIESLLSASPFPSVDLIMEILHPPEAAPKTILRDWEESLAFWGGGQTERGRRAAGTSLTT